VLLRGNIEIRLHGGGKRMLRDFWLMRQLHDGLMTAARKRRRSAWRGRNKNFAHRDVTPLD